MNEKEEIDETKEMQDNLDSDFRPQNPLIVYYKEIIEILTYRFGVRVNNIEDLENLQVKLEENYDKFVNSPQVEEGRIPQMMYDTAAKIIKEDAVCPDFYEDVVRKSLSLGYYPMSMEKIYETPTEQKKYEKLLSSVERDKEGRVCLIFRYFMTIRHHDKKMIVDFKRFKYPKKTRRYVRQTFADYTLTFNRNFDLCAEQIIKHYEAEGTWLVPPLLDTFRSIHNNPDSEVSVDSVELWHGDELVAGELGFITHNAYASLCGFHTENNSGTIQMATLGTWLKENGFAYWDLGMEMSYKYVYGATSMSRERQKQYFEKLGPARLTLPKEPIRIGDLFHL